MKKIYQIIFAITLIVSANKSISAQTTIVCDTSGLTTPIDQFPQFLKPIAQVNILPFTGAGNGGYFFGTMYSSNALINASAIGQAYENEGEANIIGVLSIYGVKKKNVNNPASSNIIFNIHEFVDGGASDDINSDPLVVTWGLRKGPSINPVGTASLSFEEIEITTSVQTSADLIFNFSPLAQPVKVMGDYVISANFEQMKNIGDTVCIFVDMFGNGNALKYTFHKIINRPDTQTDWITTVSLLGSSGDINIGLFAVLNCDTTIIEPNNVIDMADYAGMYGIKAVLYPNPATDNLNIALQLSNSGNYTVEIMDLQGRKISSNSLGFRAAGEYTETLPVDDLTAGNYIFSIVHENGIRFTKMFVKQ